MYETGIGINGYPYDLPGFNLNNFVMGAVARVNDLFVEAPGSNVLAPSSILAVASVNDYPDDWKVGASRY